MSNSYYNASGFPSTGSPATSASMRAELALVAAGFDKLPTLSGNQDKLIAVNSSGTGLTVITTLPAMSISDNLITFQDNGDATRQFRFEASGITPGTVRVLSVPDATTTLVGIDVTQTLTNKTVIKKVLL